MLRIELVPDLSHCVETVARREYGDTVRELLATGEGSEDLKERIELLRLFLETMDFKELRRESERYLLEGRKVRFVVFMQDGASRYDLRVT